MSQKTFDNLRGSGYTGSLQDMQKAALIDLGYPTMYDYLGSLGYVGALSDRLRQLAVASGFNNFSEFYHLQGLFSGGTLVANQLTYNNGTDSITYNGDPVLYSPSRLLTSSGDVFLTSAGETFILAG